MGGDGVWGGGGGGGTASLKVYHQKFCSIRRSEYISEYVQK